MCANKLPEWSPESAHSNRGAFLQSHQYRRDVALTSKPCPKRSASEALDPARAALSIPPMKAIAKSSRAEACTGYLPPTQSRSEALARVRAFFRRLDVRCRSPSARSAFVHLKLSDGADRSRLDQPFCGGSRGRGSRARRALRADGAGARTFAGEAGGSPLCKTPDLPTPRSHQETWADCLTRTFAPTWTRS